MAASITVCVTCKHAPGLQFDADGKTGGRRLAEAIAAILPPDDAIAIRTHECLWACRESCTVLIEGTARPGYLAGRFVPDIAAAEAIVQWTLAYLASPDGVVAFRDWPEGIKGHFIARLPREHAEKQDA